jgi:DNA processing protein
MLEREAYIALNMMEGVGPVGVRALMDALGSAEAVWRAPAEELRRGGEAARRSAAAILEQRESVDWRGEVARAEGHGVRLVTPVDEEYPRRLLEIHDPPLALYVCGTLQERDRHAVAVVGTRRPTHYGRDTTAALAGQLARCGLTVVSGLAEGVDTAAHTAALEAGGRTLAVVGGGLDRLYPASNRGLAASIVKHGAVLSEFPFGRSPDKASFAIRNRVVSGLSMGVLVVEAGVRSGALITVRAALDQNRSVFAVPGRIDSPASAGTNALIQQGAQLVTSPDDILRSFEWLVPAGLAGARPAAPPPAALSPEEERVAAALAGGAIQVDELVRACELPVSQVNALLIMLEMKRQVRMLPGRIVERVTSAAG